VNGKITAIYDPKKELKMLDDVIFQPETIAAFRQVCSDKREVLEYMQNFGAPIERAMAKIIFSVTGRERIKTHGTCK